MWNSYRTPTERWQKTSDLPKGKKLPTYLGRTKEKKKKQWQKNRDGTCTSGRELWRRKSFHTLGSPFTGGDRGWQRGSFGAMEESAATKVRRAKRRDSRTEDWCRPALTSPRGLSAHPLGRVVAGSWGSGFGVQTPGRGLGLAAWTQPEGASVPQLAGRESGKRSGAAEEVGDHCFRVRKERGFRAPPKWALEMGASQGYQRRPQRRAWDAKAAAAATKKPVCKHRLLSIPPLLGACAARHCQAPVIQGQLTRENTRRASGWCNVMPASAATGSPRKHTPPSPGLSEPEPPKQLLL